MIQPSRILILTGSHLCRNPRVVKEASTLGAAGYAVTVLGIRSHRPSIALDTDLAAKSGLFRHEQIELLNGPAAFLRRARTRLARDLVRQTKLEVPSALGPAPALLHAARRIPADLIIAHTEPALWVATRLLDEGCRVAADLEDWHSEDLLPTARTTRPLRLLRRLERDLLERAVYVSTPSHALAEALHTRYHGRRAAVLPNAFPLAPTPAPPVSKPAQAGPSLFWFSQTTGPGRGLEPFLAAWTRTGQASRVVLLGEVPGAYRQHLLNLLPPSHRTRLVFASPVPPAALPGTIMEHEIGLALEDASIPSRDLTITNKILQYLNGGLALLATPTTGQREVLANAPGAGALDTFADPVASAARLDALLADPARIATMRTAARAAAAEHYCWEKHAPVLLDLVARALARSI